MAHKRVQKHIKTMEESKKVFLIPKVNPIYLRYIEEERRKQQVRPLQTFFRRVVPWHRRQKTISGTKFPRDQLEAVYGLHRNTKGEDLPIHGPVGLDEYYPTWGGVGKKYYSNAPSTSVFSPAIRKSQIKFLSKRGFVFKGFLGSGGYAEVWRVTAKKVLKRNDRYIPVDLACKIMSLARFESNSTVAEAVHELLREADIYKTLNHPNIVRCEQTVNYYDKKSGFPEPIMVFIFMELCDGNLSSLIRRNQLSENQSQQWFREIASALKYLHQQNVVHMDIKPENILYITDSNGNRTFKLTDFGVAKKLMSGEEPYSKEAVGTGHFIAPEVNPFGFNPKQADIYSLGMTLVESVCPNLTEHSRTLFLDKINNWVMDYYQEYGVRQELAELITGMTDEASERFTIQQVCQHIWTTTDLKYLWP